MENKVTPTRQERRDHIYGPTRTAERVLAQSAIRDYNTSGNDLDDLTVAFDIAADNEKIKARWNPFS
jgi:hypothetical protein